MGKGYVLCLFLIACAGNNNQPPISGGGNCGDGIKTVDEDCDDGNNDDGDGCSAECVLECGNGQLEGDEACDDGNRSNGDGCSKQCTIEPRCGDNTLDEGEACDDGNTANDDGCSSTCRVESCGDGVQQLNEQCDDHNVLDDDGCSSTCKTERCGDHIQQASEECDDGNTTNNDGCSSTCKSEHCGDHIQQANEGCDDGNQANNDGCSSTCTVERCGDNVQQANEECEDGNAVSGDGCSSTCHIEHVCGDHLVIAPEECDDGNLINGDGCSSTCHLELVRNITASWVTQDVAGTVQPCLAPTVTFHYRQVDATGAFIGPDQSTSAGCTSGGSGFVVSAQLLAGRYRVFLDDGGVATSVDKIVDVTLANGTYTTRFITDGGYFKAAWRLIGMTDMTQHDCAYYGFGANGKVKLTATLTTAPMTQTTFQAACVDGFLVTESQALPQNTSYTVELEGRSSADDQLGHTDGILGPFMILGHNHVTDVGLQTIKIPNF